MAYHAIDFNADYKDQKEATAPFIETFFKKRVPTWVEFFERRLTLNAGSDYFVGQSLTYVDLAIFLLFEGQDAVIDKKDYWAKMREDGKMKAIDAFCERIRERPLIKKWITEGRAARGLKFEGDSCPGN